MPTLARHLPARRLLCRWFVGRGCPLRLRRGNAAL